MRDVDELPSASSGRKYARIEYERRFLLSVVPPRTDLARPTRIVDRYFTEPRLRLREMAHSNGTTEWKLTQKVAIDAQRGWMTTIYLAQPDYSALLALGGGEVVKMRFKLAQSDGRLYGINVFQGKLEGLILAEFECEGDEELAALQTPEFAVAEVTGDEMLTGGRLAVVLRDELRRHMIEQYGAGI